MTYQCNDGFRPNAVMISTCGYNRLWFPNPGDHICTLITGILFALEYSGTSHIRSQYEQPFGYAELLTVQCCILLQLLAPLAILSRIARFN